MSPTIAPHPPSASRAGGPVKADVRNYVLVTAAYWSETLTDGALRTLVLFYFYQLGYSPFALAALFLLYEFFGVVTNLFGGWVGARLGLNTTLYAGLAIEILALGMLALNPLWLTVPYVMASQALSGIAKDLTKMSSKSAIKLVVPERADSVLFKWVALLTGSKNALKGAGFFLGALLLAVIGFRATVVALAVLVALALLGVSTSLTRELGKAKSKVAFSQIFAKSRAINLLSAARLFLFGARDVWFVVGLPVFLLAVLGWDYWQSGAFLALWVIGYGGVQALAPGIIRRALSRSRTGPAANDAPPVSPESRGPDGRTAVWLAFVLAVFPAAIAVALLTGLPAGPVVIVGLAAFGVVFAVNSSVHSYLILAYTEGDKVALNVGFYYMANAGGRLLGTLLSGLLYQAGGLVACLGVSAAFVLLAGFLSLPLPALPASAAQLTLGGDVGE
jgi:hypothetical protein